MFSMRKRLLSSLSIGILTFSLVTSPNVAAQGTDTTNTSNATNAANAADTTNVANTPNQNNNGSAGDPPSGENVRSNEEEIQIEAQTPASVTGETMQGNGTVVDYTTTGSKAFYTIVDSQQKTFYLVIDMDKTQNNVYFLKDVNQTELEGAATNNEVTEGVAPTPPVESAETSQETGNSGLGFGLVVLLLAVAGVAAYYFLVMKKRHQQNKIEPSDEEDDEMIDYYDDWEDDENLEVDPNKENKKGSNKS